MIEFIKNNQWIFWTIAAIGTVITSFLLVKNWLQKLNEVNRKIFDETLKSKFVDLFEFKKSNSFSQLQIATNDFNPSAISGFCYRVRDFKEKGNYFKGLLTQYRFIKLYKIAKKIDDYTNKPHFPLSAMAQPDETYMEMYNDNKVGFENLKKSYKKFYLSIFDNL